MLAGEDLRKETSFHKLLENRQMVFWICLGYAKNPVEAEELAQDVFIKAWSNLESLRDEEKRREWLLRIARNTCLDHQKKMRLRRFFESGRAEEPRDEMSPEKLVLFRGELRLLKKAVRSLPRKLRDTFILREYGDLSYKEIAETLGIKEGTVMSRLNGARQKIKERMKGLDHGK